MMENIDLLYDHYKDTFEQQKVFLKKRDIYTYILLGIVLLFSFKHQEADTTEKIVNHILEEYIGNICIRITYVNTIVSIVYMIFCMTYFQVCLNIERLYPYIHKLENNLSAEGLTIEREGFNYLNSYPWLLWWVHRIYQIGLPFGLIIVAILQIYDYSSMDLSLYSSINILIFSISIVLTLLYISYLHCNEKYFDKNRYPDFQLKERLKLYFKNNSSNDI